MKFGDFMPIRILGKGRFETVITVKLKKNNKKYAMKVNFFN